MSAYPLSLPADRNLVRVYVWEWPVRVTHWVIAGSILACALTGLYMGNPSLTVAGSWQGFTMGFIKVVHFYSAWAFSLAVISRIAWMFIGNQYATWDKFIPVAAKRRSGILPTLRFYLFLLRKPPGFVGHNPVAGLTYTLVFGLYAVMIVTGLALYSAGAAVGSPAYLFRDLIPIVGGLQTARWIHHVTMWLLLGFAVHHVYSSVLMSQVEANATVESMVSGYKFVPREDLTYSGYRFVPRGEKVDG